MIKRIRSVFRDGDSNRSRSESSIMEINMLIYSHLCVSVLLYVYKNIKEYNSTSPSAAMMAICLQYVPAKEEREN